MYICDIESNLTIKRNNANILLYYYILYLCILLLRRGYSKLSKVRIYYLASLQCWKRQFTYHTVLPEVKEEHTDGKICQNAVQHSIMFYIIIISRSKKFIVNGKDKVKSRK